MDRVLAVLVLAAVPLASAVIALTSGPLPERVATHFGAAGAANGWMARGDYVALMAALALLLPLAVWVSVAVLPRRWPRLVNVPMRDFWFSPARREETIRALGRFAAVMALLIAGFLVGLHFAILEANASTPVRLPMATFGLLMGTFGVGVAAAVIALTWRFRGKR